MDEIMKKIHILHAGKKIIEIHLLYPELHEFE